MLFPSLCPTATLKLIIDTVEEEISGESKGAQLEGVEGRKTWNGVKNEVNGGGVGGAGASSSGRGTLGGGVGGAAASSSGNYKQ